MTQTESQIKMGKMLTVTFTQDDVLPVKFRVTELIYSKHLMNYNNSM